MISSKKQAFEQRMQVLHDKYCMQLPGKYDEIESSWNDYQANLDQADSIETFYRLIHTLKGTAATFGFNAQADICYKIQKILLTENHSLIEKENIQKIQGYLEELKANINIPADDISL